MSTLASMLLWANVADSLGRSRNLVKTESGFLVCLRSLHLEILNSCATPLSLPCEAQVRRFFESLPSYRGCARFRGVTFIHLSTERGVEQ